ncbi:MAG: 2-nonaprenyl-3-methyl-6-methoxy-1,4-benzoquinol hydroxylase [Betaproteobacteria bacterium]|nr:MAG: 2-nonaprenyl-3-methyl-6-methoxy-1,4-benzoquinol hydroxylase [Betaproteobacteria bacterium]
MRTAGSPIDELLGIADRALRTLAAAPAPARPYPVQEPSDQLSDDERRESAALMRVNHVGEVCAQALYEAQALGARDGQLREAFLAAARDEVDHLAWTQRRISELGGRTSLLNPLWYAGAFGIGLLASRLGDRASLGFMAETERQVEAHLQGHLDRLPASDTASRAVVKQMQNDEIHHAHTATVMGGVELPLPVRAAMRLAAKVMTTTAHYV